MPVVGRISLLDSKSEALNKLLVSDNDVGCQRRRLLLYNGNLERTER